MTIGRIPILFFSKRCWTIGMQRRLIDDLQIIIVMKWRCHKCHKWRGDVELSMSKLSTVMTVSKLWGCRLPKPDLKKWNCECVNFTLLHHYHLHNGSTERMSFQQMDIAQISRPRELFPKGFNKVLSRSSWCTACIGWDWWWCWFFGDDVMIMMVLAESEKPW